MKKIFLILIPLVFLGFIAGKAFQLSAGNEHNTADLTIEKVSEVEKAPKIHAGSQDRIKQSLNCKSCHASEYPTKNDPGLMNCPRTDMVSVYHSPAEGPETVVIDEMSDYYTGVVFSHRVHAEMSEMSEGCTGCHHYNTTGPVLNCRKCHDNSRIREDISVPDLKAAYHRQCMTCHKQWSNSNGCNGLCHKRNRNDKEKSLDTLRSRSHPQITLPTKLVWETNTKVNKTVTFFHNEHIQIFKIGCASCHNQESCIKCHSVKAHGDQNRIVKIERSVEEHHKPCSNCHLGNSCRKCHQDKEMTPFDHAKSGGWALNTFHIKLDCSKCHGSKMPYRKLDNKCVSCHKSFSSAFDHKLVGFVFSENHKGLECKNCHTSGDFSKLPVCTECHDDKSYPAEIPGKKL